MFDRTMAPRFLGAIVVFGVLATRPSPTHVGEGASSRLDECDRLGYAGEEFDGLVGGACFGHRGDDDPPAVEVEDPVAVGRGQFERPARRLARRFPRSACRRRPCTPGGRGGSRSARGTARGSRPVPGDWLRRRAVRPCAASAAARSSTVGPTRRDGASASHGSVKTRVGVEYVDVCEASSTSGHTNASRPWKPAGTSKTASGASGSPSAVSPHRPGPYRGVSPMTV